MVPIPERNVSIILNLQEQRYFFSTTYSLSTLNITPLWSCHIELRKGGSEKLREDPQLAQHHPAGMSSAVSDSVSPSACSVCDARQTEQVSGHEMRTEPCLTSNTKTDFSFNLHYFFIFMHLWTAWAQLGPDTQVWNWVRKVIWRKSSCFSAEWAFTSLFLFPQGQKKVNSGFPLFCLIEIFAKILFPPLRHLKCHVRLSLTFLARLFGMQSRPWLEEIPTTYGAAPPLLLLSEMPVTAVPTFYLKCPRRLYNHTQRVFHGEKQNTKPVVRNSGLLSKDDTLATMWPWGLHNFPEKYRSANFLEFYLPVEIYCLLQSIRGKK